tara:strand:- start:16677 stop:16787 length:111 start_codon:yes stop_codon:yes gene_type:complete
MSRYKICNAGFKNITEIDARLLELEEEKKLLLSIKD